MEKRGGIVTAIDLGQDAPWDVVPHPYLDEETLVSNMRRNVRKVENAFWYCHRALHSKVQLVYGSVYDVPKVVKPVEIALMSNVLQHFRDPLMAIQRVAQVVTETLVITETLWHDEPGFVDSAAIRLIPRSETPEVCHSWYQASPSFVMELVKLLGFPEMKCEVHDQQFNATSADFVPRKIKHFTVTARRPRPLAPAALAQLPVEYLAGFHAPERDDKRRWRWTSAQQAEITVTNLSDQEVAVSLAFGLASVTPSATVTLTANEAPVWQGTSFFGIRPVHVPSLTLRPGRTILRFSSTGAVAIQGTEESRPLCLKLFELTLCQPCASI